MTHLFGDPATQHFIRQGIARLRDEFRGIFSEQTIQRFVDEAMASLASARIKDYVPTVRQSFRARAASGTGAGSGQSHQGHA